MHVHVEDERTIAEPRRGQLNAMLDVGLAMPSWLLALGRLNFESIGGGHAAPFPWE
jgi:hypothetical protein